MEGASSPPAPGSPSTPSTLAVSPSAFAAMEVDEPSTTISAGASGTSPVGRRGEHSPDMSVSGSRTPPQSSSASFSGSFWGSGVSLVLGNDAEGDLVARVESTPDIEAFLEGDFDTEETETEEETAGVEEPVETPASPRT